MSVRIPTIHGFVTPTEDDCAYMEYLDDLYDAPDYGLLMFKGDPDAFNIGRDEWLAERKP